MLERLRRKIREFQLAIRRQFDSHYGADDAFQEGQLLPIRVEADRHAVRRRR